MTALIVIAVLVVIIAVILSVSATFTITYTDKWKTTISILWIEKDIELTKILNFILFPQKAANEAKSAKGKEKKKETASKPESEKPAASEPAEPSGTQAAQPAPQADTAAEPQKSNAPAQQKEKKPNFIKNIWDKDGIVGIMDLVSNMLETASSALSVLMKGFHIYSLYVKIIVGGGDADEIARAYGRICGVLGGMKVDNFDDLIVPDFIAPRNEYGFQFIGSISVGLLLKVALSAGKTFLVNIIKNNNK